jgi:hypothetical protein
MASYEYDEQTANEATGFSGFGGHSLAQINGGEVRAMEMLGEGGNDFVTTLSALGIEDAEQLIAISAIPDTREELQLGLGLKDKNFNATLERVRNMLPPERAALVSTPAPKDFGLGVLAPTAEMIAAAKSSVTTAEDEMVETAIELPSSVNLIPFMTPIRNQGPRGTCVSYALSALNEYILRRRNIPRDLSEQHLYYEIKLIDGSPSGCGTWQQKAVNALRLRGQCREITWGYRPNLPCNNHGPLPAQARPDGLNYRLQTIAVSARNVLAYKNHMSRQRPITISIPVYNSWYQSAETRRSGRITMRLGNEPAVGGHAVCLVGYQDSPTSPGGGFFIVRNSWGPSGFGYQCPFGAGYGTIPYQYITNDAYMMESYTAVVPGILSDEDGGDGGDEKVKTGNETVTIEVGSNVKITITPN